VPDRLLASYYLYQATANCVFFTPIFVLYYQERVGLAVATVLWLQSYALCVRALLELPFGALADRYSRRACLQAGAVAYVVGATGLLVRPTLVGALVAETFFAAGSALRSGADSAFLFDALEKGDRLDLYPQAESRGQALTSLASGTTAVVGGLLAAVDLRLPYVATVIAAAASATIARRLGQDVRPARREGSTRGLMVETAHHAASSPAIRWVMALAAFAVVTSHVYFYLQQPYLRAIGVPVAAFGVVFAATKIVTAVVATAAYRVDARLGALGAAALMTVAPAAGLWAMSAATVPLGATLLLTRGVLDGLWQPLTNVYLNRLVASRLRATMLSLQNLVARLALAGALALLGVGVARDGVAGTLAATAIGAGVLGTALVMRGARLVVRGRVVAEAE
jgi:MFS family permease